jgi:hypothetical protein
MRALFSHLSPANVFPFFPDLNVFIESSSRTSRTRDRARVGPPPASQGVVLSSPDSRSCRSSTRWISGARDSGSIFLSLSLSLCLKSSRSQLLRGNAGPARRRRARDRAEVRRLIPSHRGGRGGRGSLDNMISLAVQYQMTRCGSQARQRRKTGVSQSEKRVHYSHGSRTGHVSQVGKG